MTCRFNEWQEFTLFYNEYMVWWVYSESKIIRITKRLKSGGMGYCRQVYIVETVTFVSYLELSKLTHKSGNIYA